MLAIHSPRLSAVVTEQFTVFGTSGFIGKRLVFAATRCRP